MSILSALTHPVYVRARQAAQARPELRFARAAVAPPLAPPVTRLSNAPVRLRTLIGWPQAAGSTPADPPTSPPESPTPTTPRPEPAAPEITDVPPDQVTVPVREPPVMPQPMA